MQSDERYTVPLYSIPLAAFHLGMNPQTLRYWASRDSLLTVLEGGSGQPTLPFMALAEAQVFREFRRAGLSMQAVTTGMRQVRKFLGDRLLLEGVLAHDGRDILMNLAASGDAQWTRARDLQGGLPKVIEIGLRPIEWDAHGIPQAVCLTAYEEADVIADPRFAFGQPIIRDARVRVEDILSLFKAGETIQTVSYEMNVAPTTVESIVRTHVALAA